MVLEAAQLERLAWVDHPNFVKKRKIPLNKHFVCFIHITLTDANINCGICGEKFSAFAAHKFFANSDAIVALQFVLSWFVSGCDDELRLKLSGEFKHVDGDVKPANPTKPNFCCCNDAKFCKFWKLSIFCTTNCERVKRTAVEIKAFIVFLIEMVLLVGRKLSNDICTH